MLMSGNCDDIKEQYMMEYLTLQIFLSHLPFPQCSLVCLEKVLPEDRTALIPVWFQAPGGIRHHLVRFDKNRLMMQPLTLPPYFQFG